MSTTKVRVDLIKNYLYDHRMTKGEFCKIAKMSPITFRNILSGSDSYTITSIRKIASAMSIPVATLFKKVD